MAEKVKYDPRRGAICEAPAWMVPCKGAFVLTGRAMLVYLGILALASGIAFGAGIAWQKREAQHVIEVHEVTEIQDGILEEIEWLRGTVNGQGEDLAALQKCADAAGWKKVQAMRDSTGNQMVEWGRPGRGQ